MIKMFHNNNVLKSFQEWLEGAKMTIFEKRDLGWLKQVRRYPRQLDQVIRDS